METLSNTQLGEARQHWPDRMARALSVAARVLSAHPNPRVGCVLEKKGTVIAEGWHEAPGQAHAEIMALANAGDEARGATAFVSLEPCAHHGRTGPCCEALIAAGVSEVVIASLDPNPEVAGAGVAAMEAAGIPVWHLADFEIEARALNRGYFKRREQGLPWVTIKSAMSLDGRTAMADGEAKWITGADARADVQLLRLCHDAIITGVNTVLLDDPSLNVRSQHLQLSDDQARDNAALLARQPLRIILDSQLRTPGTARTLGIEGDCLIFSSEAAAQKKANPGKARVIGLEEEAGRVSLASVLKLLAAEYECNQVLLEAGPTLGAAFIKAGLVDELVVYMAPKLLGSDARPLFELAGFDSLANSIEFVCQEVRQIGQDVRLRYSPLR